MDIGGQRRSDNVEDRGEGSGGGYGGRGVPVGLISTLIQLLGFKGTLVVAALVGIGYLVMPTSLRQSITGGGSGGSACKASATNAQACDFSRAILASTEDVWRDKFQKNELPHYGAPARPYQDPTLVVFLRGVKTGGCGGATSAVGPFYCPVDRKLYIDPTFYEVMEKRLKAPGDFAQAYVIAHEVGHHVQNLIGSSSLEVRGETKNQVSVRVELQADCLAGVWGYSAKAKLRISAEDLKEALNAAHQIGDNALGEKDERKYTHGSSQQRVRWFERGFETGDARQCDTFAVKNHAEL